MSGYPVYPAAVPVQSNAVAYVAIFLALIAIILVIIIIFVAFSGSETLADVVDRWRIVNGTTTATPVSESFFGSPNTIFIVGAAVPSGYTVTVNPYNDIANVLVTNVATMFIIDATRATVPVKVVGGTGITISPTTTSISATFGTFIQPGNSGTFYWTSPTTINRLSTTST